MNRLLNKFLNITVTIVTIVCKANTSSASHEDIAYNNAFIAFNQAKAGDSDAVKKATDLFCQLSQQYPQNPLYRAYCGSVTTMQAKNAWFPMTTNLLNKCY
ncbi:MAG: hypothetical protein JW841_02315 [Deltaproteobacteria bacterium]|nr:hypothetical protein [Deltaproteobacteria bacterium]